MMLSVTNSLTAFFVLRYNKQKDSLRFILNGDVPKLIMIKTYKTLVEDGLMQPIEIISQEDKIKLADECRATGLKFTNKTLINSAKILHAIKCINENS